MNEPAPACNMRQVHSQDDTQHYLSIARPGWIAQDILNVVVVVSGEWAGRAKCGRQPYCTVLYYYSLHAR
jgi:hypothetical protein